MTTAFDTDVLICAATPGHPLGRRVAVSFDVVPREIVGIGSALLLPEVLAKPMRQDPESSEVAWLTGLLGRLELRPVDAATSRLALDFAVKYGLQAADAVHLATAVLARADRFLTNNRRDFPRTISEIDIVYPEDLPDPGDPQVEVGSSEG